MALRWLGNTTTDAASLGAVLTSLTAERVSLFDLHVYDAVWASANGALVAAAASSSDKTKPPSGREIMEMIAQGLVPGFRGAAGFHRFLPNGDPDMNFIQVQITNYQVKPGSPRGKQVVIGMVDLHESSGGITLSQMQPISWPSGDEYPYVSNRAIYFYKSCRAN